MPKRVGFLYEAMLNKDLIRATIHKSAKNKRKRGDVRTVLDNIDSHVDSLYELLATESFVPCKPKVRDIIDDRSKKERRIHYVPFYPDGIMHNLIVEVLDPIFMRSMYHWSCASIPGRGTTYAAKRVKSIIAKDPKGVKYVCEVDIKKFYPSVNHRLMIWTLARKVKDKKLLKLVWDILKSAPAAGLPIGYSLSQRLANLFLEVLDHYIMTLPGVKYMVRYKDDIEMFGSNSKLLHRARRAIEIFLNEKLGLEMKGNWQVYPLKSRMVDFVGFRFGYNHMILRKRNFLRLIRQSKRIQKKQARGEMIPFKQSSGFLSRAGQLKHFNSHNARVRHVDTIKIKQLKEVVRYESKRRQSAISSIHIRAAA